MKLARGVAMKSIQYLWCIVNLCGLLYALVWYPFIDFFVPTGDIVVRGIVTVLLDVGLLIASFLMGIIVTVFQTCRPPYRFEITLIINGLVVILLLCIFMSYE